MAAKTILRPEVMQKIAKLHSTPEFREKIRKSMSTPKMRKLLSIRAKKQWQNEEYKQYMKKKFIEFYNSSPQYQIQNNKMLMAQQKAYWANPENRESQSKRITEFFEKHPEQKNKLSILAKQQWDNTDLKTWRSRKTQKQWTPEFREKRKTAYDKTYLQNCLSILKKIQEQEGTVSEPLYNEISIKTKNKNLLKFDTLINRFFGGDDKRMKEAVSNYNHKVVSVTTLEKRMDVYDIEVPNTHNFALASGVFVHNSAKQGRDRKFQAILPLRGKILNTERARLDKILEFEEIKTLIIAIGAGIGDTFNIEKVRYHRIVLMTDADVDGEHIATLLLTFIFRYLPQLIDRGFIYIAMPPLYKITSGRESFYVFTDDEKDAKVKEIGVGKPIGIQRYKGLGEMNPEQLWETTMNPQSRIMKQIRIEDAAEADRVFSMLMGDEVPPRKRFIQTHAKNANLDI